MCLTPKGKKNKFGIYKTYFNLGQSTTNLQNDSKDKAKVDGSAKLNMPLKPVLLSLQAQLSESKDRLANSTTGIKTKTRKKKTKQGKNRTKQGKIRRF